MGPVRYLTIAEWEAEVGRQVRELRLRRNRSQAELARNANIATSTLAALERGEGSSLATLVAVARALDRTEWLTQLAPPEPPSPIAMLEAQRRARFAVRKRASGRRGNKS